MKDIARWIRPALVVATLTLPAGCAAAAGSAAGAGAAAYVNDQTASSAVDASVATVSGGTRSAFDDLGITVTKTETESGGYELQGTQGDLTVKASVDQDGSGTKVEVTATRNKVDCDKSYAQKVLGQILSHRG